MFSFRKKKEQPQEDPYLKERAEFKKLINAIFAILSLKEHPLKKDIKTKYKGQPWVGPKVSISPYYIDYQYNSSAYYYAQGYSWYQKIEIHLIENNTLVASCRDSIPIWEYEKVCEDFPEIKDHVKKILSSLLECSSKLDTMRLMEKLEAERLEKERIKSLVKSFNI